MELGQDLVEHAQETGRRKVLESYGLLQSDPGQAFDRITRLVADIFSVPQAYISLVDDQDQWFQNSYGLEGHRLPKELTFCNEVVVTDKALVVPDALLDARFSNHPNVVKAPFIRFYTGVPLRDETGMVLGALCIIDQKPGPNLTPAEISRLQDFAYIIMGEMNLRRTAVQRDNARLFLERAVDFSELVVWQLNPATDRVEMTGAANQIWGVSADMPVDTGLKVLALVHDEDRAEVQTRLTDSIRNSTPFHAEFRVNHPTSGLRWVEAKGDWIERGEERLLTGVNADITERKNRQEHANLLMRELHHRMRNLFATVGAIISLTRQSSESIDDYYERVSFRLDALNRAQNVLLSANFMTGTMHALMREVEAGFPRINWSGPDMILPENALVSMALLLNELATNAVKHGAFMSDTGAVTVRWWHETNEEGARKFHLRWTEQNGQKRVGPPERTRFGTLLMDRSVKNNLGGHIERNWQESGLICDIILPARWREA